MLKFTSVSASVRAITDITLTVTIIRTDITDRTIGTAGIVIIGIVIITDTSLTGIATTGWLERISSQPNFFERERAEETAARDEAVYFDFGEVAGLVAGLLPGSSSWNSFLNC